MLDHHPPVAPGTPEQLDRSKKQLVFKFAHFIHLTTWPVDLGSNFVLNWIMFFFPIFFSLKSI